MISLTIALVDPQPVARNGLKWALASSCFSNSVILEADSHQALTEVSLTTKIDMLLTDVSLPDRIGVEWLKEIKTKGLARFVAVHTALDNELLIRTVFRMGVRGFISKNLDPLHVINCLVAMAAGDHYVSSNYQLSIERWLALGKASRKRSLFELTSREYQVVSELAAGKNNAEIADSLRLSKRSIETYRSNILQKLGFRSTNELVAFAVRTGFTYSKF
jgi:DNA-binding NarL/FixJ family response regulator